MKSVCNFLFQTFIRITPYPRKILMLTFAILMIQKKRNNFENNVVEPSWLLNLIFFFILIQSAAAKLQLVLDKLTVLKSWCKSNICVKQHQITYCYDYCCECTHIISIIITEYYRLMNDCIHTSRYSRHRCTRAHTEFHIINDYYQSAR